MQMRKLLNEAKLAEYKMKLRQMTDVQLAQEWETEPEETVDPEESPFGRFATTYAGHPTSDEPNSPYRAIREEAGRRIDPNNIEWKSGKAYHEEQCGLYGTFNFVRSPEIGIRVLYPYDLSEATVEALRRADSTRS
jgi:hypothetical protein